MRSGSLSILYLIESCGHGGAEAQIAMQAAYASARGHRVMVAAPGGGWLTRELARRGVASHSLTPHRGKLAAARWAREIARLVRAERADLIQAYLLQMNVAGALAGKLTGTPVVASVRGRVYDFERRSRLWAYRAIARAGAVLTTPSLDLREALVRRAGVPPRRVVAIHNGVDLPALDRLLASPDRSWLPPGFRVGAIGRLDAVKGLQYLLDAAAIIAPQASDARFLFVGDGPEREALEQRARGLGLGDRVTFLGHREHAAAMLPALDVFVLPSLSEGLSNSLLEAMAASRPIIATDLGANAEVVRHREHALLVPPADASALAGAVLELRRDPALAARLAQSARARVEAHFSLARSAERYLSLYQALAQGRDWTAAETPTPERT
jgi:glycosyltransferase involved in cell wall biosynthesis